MAIWQYFLTASPTVRRTFEIESVNPTDAMTHVTNGVGEGGLGLLESQIVGGFDFPPEAGSINPAQTTFSSLTLVQEEISLIVDGVDDNTLLRTGQNGRIVATSFRENDNEIESTKSLQAPPVRSLTLGRNIEMSNSNYEVQITDTARNVTSFIARQPISSSGVGDLVVYRASGGAAPTVIQNQEDAASPINTAIQFIVPVTANRILMSVLVRANGAGTVAVVVRQDDENGDIIYETNENLVNGNNVIPVRTAFPIMNNDNLHFTLTPTVAIRGTVDNSVFTPYFEINSINDWTTERVLTMSDATGGRMIPAIGAVNIQSIPPRISVSTDLSGNHIVRFRVYNRDLITSMSLFIDNNGSFQVVPMTIPTGNGEQSQEVTLPTIITSSNRVLNFYIVVNNAVISSSYVVNVDTIDGTDVSIDRAQLNTVQGDNAQEMANELERLFGVVARLQAESTNRNRPLNTFEDSTAITSSNLGDWINRNNIYVRSDNARVTITPPPESALIGQYPAIFEFSHFGGTQRFDSGFSPTNTIVIGRPSDYSSSDPSTFLRRSTETGANLQFAELHQGDTGILSKQDADSPWVIIESAADPRSSILPDGVFQLNSRGVTFPTNSNGDHLIGGLTLYTPIQGDAFVVIGSGISEDSTFGRAIETGDVIVAKIDSPSQLLDENNDDWLIIRDAGHGELTLSELRFLAQITEQDSFSDSRLEERGDVADVRVFLASGILDHAPFITPSADPNNPQSDGVTYVGGDENTGSDNDFQFNQNRPSNLVYIDIDGSIQVNDHINDIFLLHKDIDGNIIERASHPNGFSLNTDFRPVILSGSGDTYYVFDDVAAQDNFSSINYIAGQTLEVVVRTTNRRWTFGAAIDALSGIMDGTITLEKLEQSVQALILSNQSIDTQLLSDLTGFELDSVSSALGNSDTFYAKLGGLSNSLSDYHSIEQQNGLLPEYERTISYSLLIPKNWVTTQLQKVEDNTQKKGISLIGVITTTDSSGVQQTWNGYSVTLPAITGANSVLDNAWQVDGNSLTQSLDIAEDNLTDELRDRIERAITPYQLPQELVEFQDNLEITSSSDVVWSLIQPLPNGIELTREAALLFDINPTITNVDELNEFEDVGAVDVVNNIASNLAYYANGGDSANRSLPGVKAYVRQDNIRFRNPSGETTPITTGFRKVIFFDYASNVRFFGVGQRVDLLRIGPSGNEPLMELTDVNGLVLRKGFADVPTETRQVKTRLRQDSGLWQDNNGILNLPNYVVDLPEDATSGAFTARLEVGMRAGFPFQVYNTDGAQTQGQDFAIPNVEASHTFSRHNFTWATSIGITTLGVDGSYNHNTRQITFVAHYPSSSGVFYWDLNSFYQRTEIVHTQTGYEDASVNVGNAGGSSPRVYRYDTMTANHRNRVGIVFVKANENDNDADPILGMYLIINNHLLGRSENGYLIDLHRRASDFNFGDLNFGNADASVGRIQMYSYDPEVGIPTSDTITSFYAGVDSWLGAFDTTDDSRTSVRIQNLEIDTIPEDDRLTEPMQFLSDHLSIFDPNPNAPHVWRTIAPAPIFSALTRRFALFFHEDRRAFTGNVFNDLPNTITFGIPTEDTRYFSDPDSQSNNDLPGVQSYLVNDRISINNNTGDTPIPNSENIILGFDYSVQGSALEQSLIRFGGAVQPLLSLRGAHNDDQGGLVLNIGSQGGSQRIRNYDIPVGVSNSQWTNTSPSTTSVIVATRSSGTTYDVRINLHRSGVDLGTDVHRYTISDLGTDQTFSNQTFNFQDGHSIVISVVYTHSNMHLTVSTASVTDAANLYTIFGSVQTFEGWRPPSATDANGAYTQVSISGDNRMLRQRNRVLLMLSTYRFGDTDPDPEMAIRIIVNNVRSGTTYQDYRIRTYRPRSDFDFNNITIGHQDSVGAPTVAVGRVQFYNYDATQIPSSEDLFTLYRGIDRFLGAFTNLNDDTRDLRLDSDVEFTSGNGIVLTSANGSKRRIVLNDDGSLSTDNL